MITPSKLQSHSPKTRLWVVDFAGGSLTLTCTLTFDISSTTIGLGVLDRAGHQVRTFP